MIKRILIALDPDPDTKIATMYGINLAKKNDASVTGLAVVDSEQFAFTSYEGGGMGALYYPGNIQEHFTENSRNEAGKLLETFKKTVTTGMVDHTEVMDEGVSYERIIEDMKYHDLLIIGRDSHFFYNRPDRNTDTMAKVVKKSSMPTLVVTKLYKKVEKVLVAFDESMAAARTLQWFVQLQPFGTDLEFELVNVNEAETNLSMKESNLLLSLTEEYLNCHGFTKINKLVLEGSTPGERLLKHQRWIGADLFILGAHSMSALKRLAFGSTTHYLITKSDIPLFMCH